MKTLAKLDMYDTMVLPGSLRIKLDASNDPIAVDIMTDITNSDAIYFDRQYFEFLGNSRMSEEYGEHYLYLNVVPV